jgi:hypothetical protein
MPNSADARFLAEGQTGHSPEPSRVGVRRERVDGAVLAGQPNLSIAAVGWSGIVLDDRSAVLLCFLDDASGLLL